MPLLYCPSIRGNPTKRPMNSPRSRLIKANKTLLPKLAPDTRRSLRHCPGVQPVPAERELSQLAALRQQRGFGGFVRSALATRCGWGDNPRSGAVPSLRPFTCRHEKASSGRRELRSCQQRGASHHCSCQPIKTGCYLTTHLNSPKACSRDFPLPSTGRGIEGEGWCLRKEQQCQAAH
jgi:hypothetical protein